MHIKWQHIKPEVHCIYRRLESKYFHPARLCICQCSGIVKLNVLKTEIYYFSKIFYGTIFFSRYKKNYSCLTRQIEEKLLIFDTADRVEIFNIWHCR